MAASRHEHNLKKKDFTTLVLWNKSTELVDKQLSLVREHIVDTGTAALPI